MNSRERVLRAIRFESPDRTPVNYSVMPGTLQRHGQAVLDLCARYPGDFWPVAMLRIPERDHAHYGPDGRYFKRWTDEWGCVWEFLQEGLNGEVKQSPLEDWSALAEYRLPPPPDLSRAALAAAREVMDRQKERYVGWGGVGNLFERMQYLRGVENLFCDIAEDREEVYRLADRLVDEYLVPHVERALAAGADIVGFVDDWGAQQQMLISPAAFRRIFKPRYARMFGMVRDAGALVWLHSDGMILDIVDDLVEIGLNVLNPQLSCHDLTALAAKTRGRLAIATDIHRQGVLQFGTSDDVRRYVREVKQAFHSPVGGLIFQVGCEADMPLANLEACLDEFFALR